MRCLTEKVFKDDTKYSNRERTPTTDLFLILHRFARRRYRQSHIPGCTAYNIIILYTVYIGTRSEYYKVLTDDGYTVSGFVYFMYILYLSVCVCVC